MLRHPSNRGGQPGPYGVICRQKGVYMVKSAKAKKWHRGAIKAKCRYCGEVFLENTPWQLYCKNSHRVMASRDRKLSVE